MNLFCSVTEGKSEEALCRGSWWSVPKGASFPFVLDGCFFYLSPLLWSEALPVSLSALVYDHKSTTFGTCEIFVLSVTC